MPPLRIMALPVDKGGCGYYRVRQPLEMLRKYTENDTYVVEKDTNEIQEIMSVLHLVDIFVVRQGIKISESKEKFNAVMKDISRATGKDLSLHARWVMDIDDNMELISPYSEHYQDSGVEEYFDRNQGKWLWKDGEGGFDLAHNRQKLADALDSLTEADMVTVTTEKLAEYAGQYNDNVVVLPNSINFDRWHKLPLKKNRQLRVGWSGGVSHYEDWYTIKKPLNELLRKYHFKLVIAGTAFKGIIDDDLQDLVEYHEEWMPFLGHSYRMMSFGLDLAIIPLADTPFNQYKSAVKWYEMSAMKVPCVIADVGPYHDEIKGDNLIFRYSDATSFRKTLLSALQHPIQRKEYAQNSYNWVYQRRNAKTNAKRWEEAFQNLTST